MRIILIALFFLSLFACTEESSIVDVNTSSEIEFRSSDCDCGLHFGGLVIETEVCMDFEIGKGCNTFSSGTYSYSVDDDGNLQLTPPSHLGQSMAVDINDINYSLNIKGCNSYAFPSQAGVVRESYLILERDGGGSTTIQIEQSKQATLNGSVQLNSQLFSGIGPGGYRCRLRIDYRVFNRGALSLITSSFNDYSDQNFGFTPVGNNTTEFSHTSDIFLCISTGDSGLGCAEGELEFFSEGIVYQLRARVNISGGSGNFLYRWVIDDLDGDEDDSDITSSSNTRTMPCGESNITVYVTDLDNPSCDPIVLGPRYRNNTKSFGCGLPF